MRIWCGIDWSERHHDVALVDDEGVLVAKRRIAESAAGFRQLLELLAEHRERSDAPILVAIETAKGLLPAALRAAGYQLFPINPLAVSRYRDRYVVSRAKSDPGDALVLANILRTDLAAHRPLPDDSELAASIRVLARAQQDAVWDRQQAANKLRSLLREYYPAMLATFDDLASRDARATLGVAPTPAAAQKLRRVHVAGGADPGRAPPQHRPPGRSDPGRAARRAVPPTRPGRAGHGPGRAGAPARTRHRGGQHRRAGTRPRRGLRPAPRRGHPDQLPRAGNRARAPESSARSATTAPASPTPKPSRRSPGPRRSPARRARRRSVTMRVVRNRRLCQAGYLWALPLLTHSPGARAHYDHRRERGDSYNAAARNLANRYFGILFHCLQHRISYDEAKAFPTPTKIAA